MTEPKRYRMDIYGSTETLDCVAYVDYYKLKLENDKLKAQIKELKNQPDALTAYLYAAELAKDDIKTLKKEVKRLTEENNK
jgi:hypothetical protein